MQTEVERLAAIIRRVDGKHAMSAGELAERLLAEGVTLPPAPVDPAWMEGAVRVMYEAPDADGVPHDFEYADPLRVEDSRLELRALLRAGYRIIPPTQDREAVIEKARRIVNGPSAVWPDVLYDAGMLVEGDGR